MESVGMDDEEGGLVGETWGQVVSTGHGAEHKLWIFASNWGVWEFVKSNILPYLMIW